MKKIIVLIVFAFAGNYANAQSSYTTALGLGIDFGTGQALVGPSIKHFFAESHGGQGEILFGQNVTWITLLYQYHDDIEGAAGLRWYAGLGPTIELYQRGSGIGLRPNVGLDYRINDVPLAFSFDWRPVLNLDRYGDTFTPGRFGLGFRYTL